MAMHGSVIFFFLGCDFVSDSRLHLLLRVIAAHDGTDCRSGQGIVNALDRESVLTPKGERFSSKADGRRQSLSSP